MNRLDCELQIKSFADNGTFTGYGSVFDIKDTYNDIVVPGAFTHTLAAWRKKGRLPAMLWQHNWQEPIGVYTRMEEDTTGLYVEGQLLVSDDPLAKRAFSHLKSGSISGMSIGYSIKPSAYQYDAEKAAYLLNQITLYEVSLVTFPANDDARVHTVKTMLASGQLPDIRTMEAILCDAGLSVKQATALLSQGFKGIAHRDDSAATLMAALQQRNYHH